MKPVPELQSGSLVLILAEPPMAREVATAFTAQLALQGRVRVLDGGNCFAAYMLARAVRRYTPELDEALNRVRVARAFTCYQMLALLEQTTELPQPTLVLDLLATFLDESVPLLERHHLLQHALDHLTRLRHQAPVAVTCTPLRVGQPQELLDLLIEISDRIIRFEDPAPPAEQLSFFKD